MARPSPNEFDPDFVDPVDDQTAMDRFIENQWMAPILNLMSPEFDAPSRGRSQDMLREQMEQLQEPQQHNMLSSPVQVASLPSAFAVDPVAQAVQAAKSVNAPMTAHEQAYAEAFLEQANLAAAIAQMQNNLDEFAAAQLAAEIAAEEEARSAMEEGREPSLAVAPPDPFSEESLGRAGFAAAHDPFGANDFADPAEHAAQVAAHAMANVGFSAEQMAEQEAQEQAENFANIGAPAVSALAAVDPFGFAGPQSLAGLEAALAENSQEQAANMANLSALSADEDDPGPMSGPIAAVDPFGFTSPVSTIGLQEAMEAAAQQQAEAMANLSGMSAEDDAEATPEVAALDPADPFGFAGPQSIAGFQAAMEAAAQQQAANMANIGFSPEAMDGQEAQEQAANFSNIGLSPAGMQAAAAQDAYMSALSHAAQVAENALSPESVAEVDAAVANLAAAIAGMPEEQAIQTLMEAFDSMMSEAQENADNAQAAGAMGAAVSPAQGMMTSAALSPAAMGAAFGPDPFSSAVSIDDPAVASSLSEMSSESDDDTSPVGVAAQSMAAANAAFGPDPFSDALGLDTLGFSDPMSDPAASAMSDPASVSDPSESESTDVGPSLGAMETGLTGVDTAVSDPAPSDPGGDAGGPSGADAGAGAGDGAGGDAGGGPSDGGPTGSGTGGDPDAWARGGRVKSKGLGASLNGSKSDGLAAMPEEDMREPEMKVSKAEAQYQDKPHGRAMCGNCAHFMPDQGGCEIVKGRISPEGWSSYFDPA